MLLILSYGQAPAAPIPGLFNTGVAADGSLLPASGGATTVVDPHYKVIESADPAFPASPEAPADTVTLLPGFPVGPWIAEGPLSKWISLNRTSGNVLEGNYTFRTTFDLTGFDPAKARIEGKWSVDNTGVDIVLNGDSLGIVNGAGFGGFSDFMIESGFVEGVNTLDFVVNNAAPDVNPAGLRVEMNGTVELPDEPPSIRTQPVGAKLGEGDAYTLMVVADGTPPLSYKWKRNDQDIGAPDSPILEFFATTPDDTGDYTVTVSNASDEVTSAVAKLDVLPFVTDVILYGTGVDDTGTPLFDYDSDPHYRIIVNPDSDFDPENSETAYAVDETVHPIGDGAWLSNSGSSRWIGPRPDVLGAAGGDYTYRLTFSVSGRDVTNMMLRGLWSTDNEARDIRINGISMGLTNAGQFNAFVPFSVSQGFINGTNTIDFVVNNASVGPTGLRVEEMTLFAPAGAAPGAPRIVGPPQGRTAIAGETVTLNVVADGQAPLEYRWRMGATVVGTEATLTIEAVQLSDEGDYTVEVSNTLGGLTTDPVRLTVLDPVPGFYNTGVDATGLPLGDLEVDPHYVLVANAHDPEVTEALAMIGLPSPPWLPNSDTSRWIGPTADTNAAEGDYIYRFTVDLTGFDPASILVTGQYATDNMGPDVLVNGVSVGLINSAQFTTYTPFVINQAFKAGVNTIDWVVNNAPPSDNPVGLRIDGIRAGGRPATPMPTLSIARTSATEVTLAWPDSFPGWNLFTSPDLRTSSWVAVTQAPVVADGMNSVTVTITGTAFFRLQQP